MTLEYKYSKFTLNDIEKVETKKKKQEKDREIITMWVQGWLYLYGQGNIKKKQGVEVVKGRYPEGSFCFMGRGTKSAISGPLIGAHPTSRRYSPTKL